MLPLGFGIPCWDDVASVAARPTVAIVAAQTTTARIHVDGIACERCSARLREGLLKLEGVAALEVNREKNEIVVTFDPERVTVERIKTEVDHYGFHAT